MELRKRALQFARIMSPVSQDGVVVGLSAEADEISSAVGNLLKLPSYVLNAEPILLFGQHDRVLGAVTGGDDALILNTAAIQKWNVTSEAVLAATQAAKLAAIRAYHQIAPRSPLGYVRNQHVYLVAAFLGVMELLEAAIASLENHGAASIQPVVGVITSEALSRFPHIRYLEARKDE
jgi:predicted phosphoribosyltransferase